MRLFLAGGTGILGRSVLRLLVARGHSVRVLSRSPENERKIRQLGGEPAAADIYRMDRLTPALEGVDAVLHLATRIPEKIRPTFSDFAENDRLRTEGTIKLLEATRLSGARLYVQQSIAFLAATPDSHLLRDDAPCVLPAPAGSPQYAASKMEELVRNAHGKHGFDTVILRGGLFYHAESQQTRQLIGAVKKRRVPIFGEGRNIISLIHVEDMAGAVVAAAETPVGGETFFVVDDHPLSFMDYINTIARLVGAAPARHWPAFLARPLLGPVVGNLPKISFNCPNTKIKAATGWAPRFPDLESGMKQVLLELEQNAPARR